ncbi:MAG: PAS domain S-box protein [Deltaproteobacteria bacterium]|nr:PAS domain S-box protein [Deltaproteobacteria bacterium]
METLNLAIVGGGNGCVVFMDRLSSDGSRRLPLNLIGVADINPEAPGIRRARELDIFTTVDYRDLFQLEDLHLILELTGSPDIVEALHREKPPWVRIMDHTIADFFWDLIDYIIDREVELRKRHEEAQRLYSEKLEREVEARTRELEAAQREALLQKEIAEGIIHGSPTPMFVIDKNHKVAYWNQACANLTGYSSEEMIGTDWHWKPWYKRKIPLLADLIIDRDYRRMKKLDERIGLRRSPLIEDAYESEHFFPQIGEKGTHIHLFAAPIKDDRGEIQGAIVTYIDITDKVRMMQELRKREAFEQNLIQNCIDGIIATDNEGKLVIFNQAASEILGYSPEEVIGRRSYSEIFSRETAKDLRKTFYSDEYGPFGKVVNKEIEVTNKQGEPVPVRFAGTLLYDNGEEVGSVAFIQDLREVRRLQKEKEQSERMAAIGETVAGVAHYIKNILNGLKGGGYVINSGIRKKDMALVEKAWRMLEKSIEQIGQIVMDMLVYAKDRKPEFRPVDPNELVMNVIGLMGERAELAGVQLVHRLDPELGEVSMDRTAIHHCLLNLVSNAIDACTLEGITRGRGKVIVMTDRPEGWSVRFRIVDNGTGMDEETQKRLFTGFFSTKGYKGTGLGLPVTLKIVKEHGGELTYESEPGKGTTFTLLLP